jgi:hypothetical protein
MKSTNPRGRPKGQPLLRVAHVRFIGECAANLYNAGECARMLKDESGVDVTYANVCHYYNKVKEFADRIRAILTEMKDTSPEAVAKAVEQIPEIMVKERMVELFDAFFQTKKLIAESPIYGVAYADKRRRLLKLDQNIRELDEKKTAIEGSYPVARHADGSTEYKQFKVSNKDHAEQRKTIETMGELVDGQTGGDIIINVHQNEALEDTNTEEELRRKRRMADMKERKGARKPLTKDLKEDED